MGIVLITLVLVGIMYGMTFLSYISENISEIQALDDTVINNQ
ncbi:MAG: hypothetical protein ACRDA3_14245 [Peptostreptococcaceae bacterium]